MEGLERLAIAQTPLSTSATHADRADELLEAPGVAVIDGALVAVQDGSSASFYSHPRIQATERSGGSDNDRHCSLEHQANGDR